MRALLGIVFLVSGCVATSSGIQRVGENRFTVSAQMSPFVLSGTENSGITRAKAIDDANAYCISRGAEYAEVTDERISRGESATTIIYFHCSQSSN